MVQMPHTRTQKGKGWATLTLFICGAFTLWANVRSGQLHADNIVVSAFPPVVAFMTTKLIAYFSPRTIWTKGFVYGGFGLITTFAMYGSGYHIIDTVVKAGQPWQTAIAYVFISDAPMLLAAALLVQKVPMTQTSAKPTEETSQTPAAKPVKAAPVKTTPPKTTTPAKRTTPAKSTKAAKSTTPAKLPDITMDPFERDMLNA